VRRLLARIDTFGFHLATLDLRQHASVHHAVLAQGLDDPQWHERSAAEQHARLVDVLARDAGPAQSFDALGKRTLAVFEAVMQSRHRYGPDAVGLYIVSAAATAADVLAPLVLAHWAGARDRRTGAAAIDVAPQFDSVATLEAAAPSCASLLADQVYQQHLAARGRLQTVLIGYSESNRESGIVASRLAAYRAQRSLTAVLDRADERHVLFYSRGGSIPRGGGRIDECCVRHPPSRSAACCVSPNRARASRRTLGCAPNAMRTLERAFNTLAMATLAVRRGVAVQESVAFADAAAQAATASRDAWRRLLDGPGFFEFFRAVTPIDVIERMRIGAAQRRESPPATSVDTGARRPVRVRDQTRAVSRRRADRGRVPPLRLRNGLYIQRMRRCCASRLPYGLLSPRSCACWRTSRASTTSGYGHFTTRQNIQYNWPQLEEVPDILADLASVEMHAIQTSGNCIRNVTSDHFAGVARRRDRGSAPYREIIRQWSTLHPEFSFLPRKFKIAVTGARTTAPL
jgi:hypothetical protein